MKLQQDCNPKHIKTGLEIDKSSVWNDCPKARSAVGNQ